MSLTSTEILPFPPSIPTSMILSSVSMESTLASSSSSPQPNGFPISLLPYEIRLQIYTEYLLSLPTLPISSHTLKALPSTTRTLLHLASPFFAQDIPQYLIYQCRNFEFSDGRVLQAFAIALIQRARGEAEEEGEGDLGKGMMSVGGWVRRIRIVYGVEEKRDDVEGNGNEWRRGESDVEDTRDWVYLMHECFPRLQEVEFVVGGKGRERKGTWGVWGECVRDASRESGRKVEVRIALR